VTVTRITVTDAATARCGHSVAGPGTLSDRDSAPPGLGLMTRSLPPAASAGPRRRSHWQVTVPESESQPRWAPVDPGDDNSMIPRFSDNFTGKRLRNYRTETQARVVTSVTRLGHTEAVSACPGPAWSHCDSVTSVESDIQPEAQCPTPPGRASAASG
jgi:hypothetical protein